MNKYGHEDWCNLMFPATLNTDEDYCDCGAHVSKTYKEQEDKKALTKNNGKSVRYLKRVQQEEDAKREQKRALKELTEENEKYGLE